MSSEKEEIIRQVKIKAGGLINRKYPHYTQINYTSSAVDNINKNLLGKDIDELSKEDTSEFEGYRTYVNKIRKISRNLTNKINKMTDEELIGFDFESDILWELD